MSNEILRIENLSKSYQGVGDGERISILSSLDLTLMGGETIAITGKSGSGKSTLLSVAALLSPKDGGKIYYDGIDTDSVKEKDLAKLRNEKMGFVFQNSMLLEDFSALENVAMPLLIRGEKKRDAIEKAQEYLILVGMEERMKHRPKHLSGGERQRTALARALSTSPALILADEPTGALDEESAAMIENLLLRKCVDNKSALVLVTHNPDFASHCETRYVLEHKGLYLL